MYGVWGLSDAAGDMIQMLTVAGGSELFGPGSVPLLMRLIPNPSEYLRHQLGPDEQLDPCSWWNLLYWGARLGGPLLAGGLVGEAGELGALGEDFGPASSAMNAERLAQQLAAEEAASLFNADGALTEEAIRQARMIIPADELGNPLIPEGFAKYSIEVGSGQVHFYMNPATGEVWYGLDYKFLFAN